VPLTGQATVQRQAQVGEDLLVGAGQATIDPGARIGGDLIFGAGRMTMDGTVAGSVLGSTGSYTKGGSVAGTEQVNVGQPQERQEPTLADCAVDSLRRYVSLLVVGGLLLWLLPRLFRGAAETVRGAFPGQPRGSASWDSSAWSWPWSCWSWSPCWWRSCWACWDSGP
jgi:hypothetical protein